MKYERFIRCGGPIADSRLPTAADWPLMIHIKENVS
jgi:hypothetical protein